MPTRSNDTRRANARQLLDQFARRFEALLSLLVDAEAMTHGASECLKSLPYIPRPKAPLPASATPAVVEKPAAVAKPPAPMASVPGATATPAKPAAPADDDFLSEEVEQRMVVGRLQSFVLGAAKATHRALAEHDRILGDLAAARARLDHYRPEPHRSLDRGGPDGSDGGNGSGSGSGNGGPH